MLKKSVISLISYDAHLLPNSIKSYYNYVDEIVLGLDEDRITWSGNKFSFDESKLYKELKRIDGDNKIKIIEENYHCSDIPIENDNRERNILKHYCNNYWVFSFDADEELINAKDFFYNYLPIVEQYYKTYDLLFSWYLPYKQFGDDILLIANNNNTPFRGDQQGFATYKNHTYTYCRWTQNKKVILSNLGILHWSFCRDEKDNSMKLNNFGHSRETKKDPFFDTWKQINLENFEQLRNFKTSGYGENQWEKLVKINKNDLHKFLYEDTKNII